MGYANIQTKTEGKNRENREKEKATKQREAKTWKLSNPLTESTRDTPWKDTKLRTQRNHKLYVSQQIGYKADYNFVCCIIAYDLANHEANTNLIVHPHKITLYLDFPNFG